MANEFEPLLTDLTHTRSCPELTPGSDDFCTCGLVWRIRLRTEMEMHNAWRKRAEESEMDAIQVMSKLTTIAQQRNQVVGEKSDYYVTLEQLESALAAATAERTPPDLFAALRETNQLLYKAYFPRIEGTSESKAAWQRYEANKNMLDDRQPPAERTQDASNECTGDQDCQHTCQPPTPDSVQQREQRAFTRGRNSGLDAVVFMLQGMQTDAINRVDRGNVIDRVRTLKDEPPASAKPDVSAKEPTK